MPAGFSLPTSAVESIVGIQFGIFSPDEIIKRSVVEVTSQSTYDGNEPKINGLFDPRMGVLDNGKKCRSCGQTNHSCPGHFGHYRLARPVYFIQFLPIVLNVLRCVCVRCSKLLIDKDSHLKLAKRRGEARWREVLGLCGNITRCGQQIEDGCGARQPNRYVRDGIARIVAEWDAVESETVKTEKVRQPLDVEYVLRLFRQITDEDVDFTGLSRHWCRPDWMICTVLPIPPPQVRPSVIQDNNQRSEDDLTHKLFEIIKMNKVLQEKIDKNANRNQIEEYTDVLQYHVATLVDNKIPGVAPSAQRGGRPLKSIQQRIGSKEGRVRYNIQGKRVEQSARTVITPDPNISIAEVGVPMKIAMNLTRPERVTRWNRAKLYKFVQNGADVFPGAKTIIRSDGRMISLKHVNTKEIVLYDGDTVNRHLMDGDILLFNRQPTLHRLSMMGHIVKVLPFNTFRLNVSVTSPYNADFDGDEMNAHIPQSYEAFMELKEIAAVPMQIIRPRDGTPVIGVVQDTLVGSHLATKPNNSFTRREFMNLMMWNKRFEGLPTPAKGLDKSSRYSGQQILSSLLAPINVDMTNSAYKDDKSPSNIIKIREGIIQQGVFDKSIFNKPGRGIVHTTYNDYGPQDTVDLLDNIQCVIENYLIMKGFSVGISDLIADSKTRDEMNIVIQKCKKEIEEIVLQVHTDLFTNNTGKSNQDEFENRAFVSLNKAISEAGKIGEGSLSSENRLIAMVKAGSKGGPINIAQMIACVGQQSPEGRRIPYGFTDRTLPHYKMYDDGAEARGFVESSFIRGLTPQEFFFHAMSGREGLIDTAVKTSETGYTQRQLIKAMEDLMIQHDGTVRDANGSIVQFHYGEDGINSTKIESCTLPLDKMTEEQIRTEFSVDSDNAELLNAFIDQVVDDRKMLIERVFGFANSMELFGPLNLERVILNIKIKFALKVDGETGLTASRILSDIDKIRNKTQPYNRMWAAQLRFHFAPHKMIAKERFTEEAWATMVDLVILKDWKAWAQPGEFVGIIAAQSIGEPATQMSCHSSTIVVINSKNLRYKGPIGPLIDGLIEKNSENVMKYGDSNVVLDLTDELEILGVSDDEKTSWKRISQVSRHPADGGLVEVHTRTGRKTTATLTHSFLKRSRTGIVPVLGSDLKVGMRIPVAKVIAQVNNPTLVVKVGKTVFNLDRELGWICGIYLADGSLNGNNVRITKIAPIVEELLTDFSDKNKFDVEVRYYRGEYGPGKDTSIKSKDLKNFLLENFGQGSYTKSVGSLAYHAPVSFIQGLVGGYFDGDGNVNAERQQIRVGSRSADLIRDINRLLGYCEMFGVVSQETSVSIPDKVLYTLSIPRKYATHYKQTIGFNLSEKAAALDEIIAYNSRDDVHSQQEMIDKIPELGPTIAQTGKLLRMPGQSRTYGRWAKKESIGRKTLEEYVSNFKEMMLVHVDPEVKETVDENMAELEAALNSNILWDEITELVYLEDPKTFVYDFTVPGNDSFMVDDNILVHNTLNTFHLAGVAAKSNMTRGVPRLKEMLKVTQNPKATSLTVYLKPAFRESKDRIREVTQDLELTILKDITNRVAVYYDPKEESTILEEDRELIKFYDIFESRETATEEEAPLKWSKWLLRLEFDREKMFNKNITMDDVHFVLADKFVGQINMIYSDFNSQKLVMRIRLAVGDSTYGDDLTGIKKLQNRILNNIVIRGLPGIRAATFRKDKDRSELVGNEYKKIEQYVIDTDGSNFIEVMNHPAVDGNRIYSTNVHDIYHQLGIEAARSALYQEISGLFEEAGINYRHLGLLCDWMTRIGRFMSVDRYGINKNDTGPLAKACFEETERILLKAALFGELDPVTGVSANIMTGQTIRGGTAFTQILLDEFALPRLMEGLPALPEEEVEEEEPDQENIDAELYEDINDVCATTQLRMNLAMPTDVAENNEDDIEIAVIDED